MSSRVMEAWEAVLRDAVADDYDDQQFALARIGMVLQRHNPHLEMPSDAPEEMLSRELIRLTLNHNKQSDTLAYLADLIRKRPAQADSVLYAMSNAQPSLLTAPLLKIILDMGDSFDDAARYHAVTALREILKHPDSAVIAAFNTYDVIPVLDEWIEGTDTLTSEKAAIVADAIEDLLESSTEE